MREYHCLGEAAPTCGGVRMAGGPLGHPAYRDEDRADWGGG